MSKATGASWGRTGWQAPAPWKPTGSTKKERRMNMAVKIIIRRKLSIENGPQLLPLLVELRTKATRQPGYISGETLRNLNDPEDCVVISTWETLENWNAWSASKERAGIDEKINGLLREKATYNIYYYG
jgi:heme-degrading monooxygenase HmoA